ncbi:MAG: BLUF domain-containing protein [Chloroflexota bacterium]
MGLISLVYVSFAAHPMTDEELKGILKVARDNNEKLDVTGMLLYRDGFFIQALEGEESVVEPLYEKIAQDPDHRNVTLVYKNAIESRSFAGWSMGFNEIGHVSEEELPGFNNFLQDTLDMDYWAEQPSRATVLLETFKQNRFF